MSRARLRGNRLWIDEYGYLILHRGTVELHFFGSPDVDPLTATGSRLEPPREHVLGTA